MAGVSNNRRFDNYRNEARLHKLLAKLGLDYVDVRINNAPAGKPARLVVDTLIVSRLIEALEAGVAFLPPPEEEEEAEVFVSAQARAAQIRAENEEKNQ